MQFAEIARSALLGTGGQKGVVAQDYAGPAPDIYGNSQSTRRIGGIASQHLQAYGGTEAVDWVMTNVRLMMETTSNADYHFERNGNRFASGRRIETDDKSLPPRDARLAELMKAPNPWMTYEDLIELTVIDMLLVGNAFWLKFRSDSQGRPLALYRLAPPLITVIPGKQKLLEAYEYKVPGAKPVRFKPEDVVQFKMPNPHSPYLGLGLIAGGPRVYDIELNLVESQASFYERGAKWAGILTSDRPVPGPVIKKVRRAFQNLYGGAGNSGSVPILERGLQFQSVQSNAAEAAFREIAELSRDRINSHFRTSRPLFGDVAGTDRQAVREAQRIFDTKTMRPFLNRIQARISADLTQAWGYDFVIDYEYKMPPEDAIDLAAGVASIPGFRVREIRELAGYEPLGPETVVTDEQAEILNVPKGTKVDDLVLNLPGSNDNASKIKDRNLPGEAGRPPNPENTQVFPAGRNKDAAAGGTGNVGRPSQRG